MKERKWFRWTLALLAAGTLVLAGCGDDGATGPQGPPGPPGSSAFDASTLPASVLGELDIQSEITDVTIASPPVVTFSVTTADGTPIVGIGDLWQDSNRFVRFTIAKLVPGTNGDPDTWVAYTRSTTGDGSTPPTYDDGDETGSLVDNGDGTYTFTFNTDVTNVTGVAYEPTLTHRVAGQIGSGSVALEPQNLVYDFVPSTGAATVGKKVAVEASCNECHDNLVIHGRRFKVDYCVNCHNPDLASGEGNMSFMTHRIHAGGGVVNGTTFAVLDAPAFGEHVSHIGYPQELANCRKCHNGADTATPDGDNWMVPNKAACMGCHDGAHPADTADNTGCTACHDDNLAPTPVTAHITLNATENNPDLIAGQYDIDYEVDSAVINAADELVITFRVLADGTFLDLTNLPADLTDGPNFRAAYALPQDGIAAPADFNNLGESAGQPLTLDPLAGVAGETLDCSNGVDCVYTLPNPFPVGATMRTVGLQDYFHQVGTADFNGDGVVDATDDGSLHTQSVVATVTGDTPRREVVDSAKCAACHEIFEGHGGNRNFTAEGGVAICTLCHVPNLSSSGRTIDVTLPEDTNNFKDLIHGIHGAAKRVAPMEFVRAFRGNANLYAFLNSDNFLDYVAPVGTNDNSHLMTYPAESSNCNMCHISGAFELPIDMNALPTTVRTTQAADGLDVTTADVEAARDAVPNAQDWVNSPTASACLYCHDTELTAIHMLQNGGEPSSPVPGVGFTDRAGYDPAETCVVCHGPGRSADVEAVHGL